MNIYLIILLIVCILFLVNKKESFIQEEIHLYVITLKHPTRLKNIEEQQVKIGREIVIFEGVNGNDLDIDTLNIPNVKINRTFYNNAKLRKRQMGCYLAHFNLYNKIKQDNLHGYSIIFEDDFEIVTDKFLIKVKEAIETLNSLHYDFDILYLGHNEAYQTNNGELVIDNIYRLGNGENVLGLYGYLINNKSIDKIVNATSDITTTIDDRMRDLSYSKTLKVYSIYPQYVTTGTLKSIINEPFQNYSFI